MSRPVHLNRKGSWGACGKQSDLQAHDYRHVTCLSCRKTHFWKTCQSFDRVAKVSKLGEYAESDSQSNSGITGAIASGASESSDHDSHDETTYQETP